MGVAFHTLSQFRFFRLILNGYQTCYDICALATNLAYINAVAKDNVAIASTGVFVIFSAFQHSVANDFAADDLPAGICVFGAKMLAERRTSWQPAMAFTATAGSVRIPYFLEVFEFVRRHLAFHRVELFACFINRLVRTPL